MHGAGLAHTGDVGHEARAEPLAQLGDEGVGAQPHGRLVGGQIRLGRRCLDHRCTSLALRIHRLNHMSITH